MRHSTMVVTVIACCVGIAITSCGKDKKASPTPRFISAWTNGISGKTFDSSSGQFSLVNNSEKTKLVNDLGWEEAENPDDYYDIIQQVEQRNAQLFVYHGHGRKGDETEGGEDANYSTQFKDASFIGMVPGGDFDPLEFELNPFKRAKAITPDLIKTDWNYRLVIMNCCWSGMADFDADGETIPKSGTYRKFIAAFRGPKIKDDPDNGVDLSVPPSYIGWPNISPKVGSVAFMDRFIIECKGGSAIVEATKNAYLWCKTVPNDSVLDLGFGPSAAEPKVFWDEDYAEANPKYNYNIKINRKLNP